MKGNSVCVLAGMLGLIASSEAHATEWTSLADMPGSGRHHPATFSIDGFGYVVTGSVSGDNATADFYRYDPMTDDWTVLPAFPGVQRSYAYAASYNGKGYLGFGVSQSGTHRNDLWEYDPGTGWTRLANCPGPGRAHPAFVITDNGKIFVGAGNTASQNLRDWWEYDIATNVWTPRPDMPAPPRHHPYHFNIGNDAYVCFGHGASIYRDVYRWSQATQSWTTMSLFPGEARVAGTEFSFGGKGYVLSGEGADHVQFEEGEFWEYDPNTDSWTQLPSHPGSSRWAPGSFLIGDILYFVGGLSTTALEKDLMQFPMTSPTSAEPPILATGTTLRIYPNPLSGSVLHILDPDAILQADGARLFDAGGREVAKLQGSGTVRVPHTIAAGQYYVALRTRNGEQVTKRVTVLR